MCNGYALHNHDVSVECMLLPSLCWVHGHEFRRNPSFILHAGGHSWQPHELPSQQLCNLQPQLEVTIYQVGLQV
jgi:hypothetical protein